MSVRPLGLLALLAALALAGCSLGEATLVPDEGGAGEYGTWTVSYTPGRGGLGAGARLLVELPDTWNQGPLNGLKHLQADTPDAPNFISATSDSARWSVQVLADFEDGVARGTRTSLDGRLGRYVLIVQATLQSGAVGAGETVEVVFGDTSGGSPGMEASKTRTEPEEVLVALQRGPLAVPQVLDRRPLLQARAGPAGRLRVSGPASLVLDTPATLRFSLVDANNNPIEPSPAAASSLAITAVQGSIEVLGPPVVAPGEAWGTLAIVPRSPGLLRLDVEEAETGLQAACNPMMVFPEPPEQSLYWGDLHSHSHLSYDGVGADPFTYARHVAGLDFYARTDHSLEPRDGVPRGLHPGIYDEYNAPAEAAHDPGVFVTLHGYEASFGAPSGHHNVYFRADPGPLVTPSTSTLQDLWDLLTPGDALTIPHHTGKFPDIDWQDDDLQLRRTMEIYSAHGLSEVDDPDHALAFDNVGFSTPLLEPTTTPLFFQDALTRGFELGTIAASDDHMAQPGKAHFGLAAVWARGLSRDAIFDGLHDRRTYATTGERILLDFTVAGSPMGSRVTPDGPAVVSIEVHGTDTLRTVELLQTTDLGEGFGPFEVVQEFSPATLDFTTDMVRVLEEPAILYVRVLQQNEVDGRPVMAWSSPVWIDQAR